MAAGSNCEFEYGNRPGPNGFGVILASGPQSVVWCLYDSKSAYIIRESREPYRASEDHRVLAGGFLQEAPFHSKHSAFDSIHRAITESIPDFLERFKRQISRAVGPF